MTDHLENSENGTALRRGWTTGACATAATKAALTALISGEFPDPVVITLPKGQQPAFALTHESLQKDHAEASIIKDAGDDPDVTHGALITVKVAFGEAGCGIVFRAGDGVGTVTRPGLPIGVGEPAINPVPRALMTQVVNSLAAAHDLQPDVEITISVRNGEKLAAKTWNPRLGIVGGLSILGTTGIVVPFSCSAWIHSIHRGVDVCIAEGQTHVAGSTGSTSERVVQGLYDLPDFAMLDMGDFVGGMLKYLRKNPVARVTIGGGFAKISKLAQGAMDLHSGRSQVDFEWMAERLQRLGADASLIERAHTANTALEILQEAQKVGLDIAGLIASEAQAKALALLGDGPIALDIIVIDRAGTLLAQTEPLTFEQHSAGSPSG
ncbi:cobalt-precorrin-5B (C1)-methyltransferase [Cohaesibacter sp. ES.047]|nr:cobalt-precorrin-5B (C(1))-methyltransferase [Cohaesibacter sp. ES.047]SNY93560.1 cobalt-precorrin-5B (C1)-methyltransferase [Cohaesibacter sp. ES.047]